MLLQNDPNSTLNNTLEIDTNYLLNLNKIQWFTKIIYDSPNRHSREELIDLGIKCVIFLDIPNRLENKTGLIQQYRVTEKESFCNGRKRYYYYTSSIFYLVTRNILYWGLNPS